MGWTVPPIHLNIDLSSRCSQNCEFCYKNNLSLGGVERFKNELFLPKKTLDKLIHEIPKVGIMGVELTGFYGEPTMHPNFDYFVDNLKTEGVLVGLITNGDFLHKIHSSSQLSYIRVSISSLKNEIHQKIRGGKRDVSDILLSLHNINKVGNAIGLSPVTGLGFTIDLYNYKEVYDLCAVAFNIGCSNVRLTPVWKNDMSYWTKISEAVTKQVKMAKKDVGDRLKIIGPDTYEKVYMGKKNYHKCYYSNLTMNITADGECYPCCVTRGVKGWSFGNINEQSLDEIIWGYPRRKLLQNINPAGCPSCIWDSKNEFIEYVVEGGMHAEFV
jgi:radical SAM protein with 4Fe4S-binding SPASM domain